MKWLRIIWTWLTSLAPSKEEIQPPAPKPEEPAKEESTGTIKVPSLFVPWAVVPERKMATSFTYINGYPQGAIVHFTAGRDETEQEALDSYDWGCDNGYVFFMIGPTGKLYQGFPLSRGGAHAGSSSYPGLGNNVSTKLVGIEIACAGQLDKWNTSWFRKQYPKEQVRNGFKKYTPEQEETLIKLLVWLKKNNPNVFNIDYILGHNEVSPGRKPDPGHSLSMSMDELRAKVKSLC